MKSRHLAAIACILIAGAVSLDAETRVERHHYTVTARIRPLVVFWISRSDVGDAVVTRRVSPQAAEYSLLIGSNPDRAPLHINRWGYIKEEIRGAESRLVGLMTESDEQSIEQAEARVRSQPTGRHVFKVIQASADGVEARSRVRSIVTPEDYTSRQLPIVLELAQRESIDGRTRVVRVPAGARPGFLSALADAMRDTSPARITYVYFGRVYELRRGRMERIPRAQIGGRSYGAAVAADFVTTSLYDREQTRFSIIYGATGSLAGVPLRVIYQPRWWMQVELTLDDDGHRSSSADGVLP